jgi:hypothetical protein
MEPPSPFGAPATEPPVPVDPPPIGYPPALAVGAPPVPSGGVTAPPPAPLAGGPPFVDPSDVLERTSFAEQPVLTMQKIAKTRDERRMELTYHSVSPPASGGLHAAPRAALMLAPSLLQGFAVLDTGV